MITFEDIHRLVTKDEAIAVLNDEFASEALIEHIEQRFGQVVDMFYINYSA